MGGSRKRHHRRKGGRERLCRSIAAIIVVLSAMTYWYDGGEDEILDGNKKKAKAASASTRRRTKQCRLSCEDIIISAARGGIVDDSSTHRNGDYDDESSKSLASSAVDALFHWHAADDDGNTSSASSTPNNPYEQQRYEDFVLYPFRRAVYSYIQQAGQDTSSSSSSGTGTDRLVPPPPSRLPPLIEALVGAVDSQYHSSRSRGGHGGDPSDGGGSSNSEHASIRMNKSDVLERAGLGGVSASDLPAAVKNGDEQAVAMAAAAAAATFWSSRSAHRIVGRHRMKTINDEWDASLRWIAGWGQEQLDANSGTSAAPTSSSSSTGERRRGGREPTKRGRRRNGVAKSKEMNKWGLDGLSNEEETELLLLIDVCVEECMGMTGGDGDRKTGNPGDSKRSPDTTSTTTPPARRDSKILGVGGNMLLTLISALTGKVASDSLIPSHQKHRIVLACVVRLTYFSIIIFCLHSAFRWLVSSSFWSLSQQKDYHSERWIDEDEVRGIRKGGGGKKKAGVGKKGRQQTKFKASPSNGSNQLSPQASDQIETVHGEEMSRDADDMVKSTSQNSLTDEDDDAILDLVRTTKTRPSKAKAVESPISSSNSLLSSPNDTPVQSPTRPPQPRRIKRAETRTQKQYRPPTPKAKSTPRRGYKAGRSANRKDGATQIKHPVPTEEQRLGAFQQLREFQRVQIEKLVQKKKDAVLAAERANAVNTKATAAVSYSAVAAGSPPLSPALSPRRSQEADPKPLAVLEALRLDSSETRAPPGLEPVTAGHTPDLTARSPLESVAGELLLSGMLEDEEGQDEKGGSRGKSGQNTNAVPPGFGGFPPHGISLENNTANPWSSGVHVANSLEVPLRGMAASDTNSSWSQSHQSEGTGGAGSNTGIW